MNEQEIEGGFKRFWTWLREHPKFTMAVIVAVLFLGVGIKLGRAASVTVPVPDGCVPTLTGYTILCAAQPIPPTPTPIPPPVVIPDRIDGLKVIDLGVAAAPIRVEIPNMNQRVAVVKIGIGTKASIAESAGGLVQRYWWVTDNPGGTPQWTRGDSNIPLVVGKYLVFKNLRDPPGSSPTFLSLYL